MTVQAVFFKPLEVDGGPFDDGFALDHRSRRLF
jgi:hypothetical protein